MVDWDRRLALLLDPDKLKTSEPRAVPLSRAAIEVLEGLPVSVRRGVVFPVERMTLYHAFIAACKRASIGDFTWHDLRHEASPVVFLGAFSGGFPARSSPILFWPLRMNHEHGNRSIFRNGSHLGVCSGSVTVCFEICQISLPITS